MKKKVTYLDFVRIMMNQYIRDNRPNPKDVNPYDSKARKRTTKTP